MHIYELAYDDFQYSVGAVLHYVVDDTTQPLGSFTMKLSQTQSRYTMFGWELLYIFKALSHFRHALNGWQLTILINLKRLSFKPLFSSAKYIDRKIRQ